jgi:predicted DNA-binding transcriptional regulator AlpA
MKPLVTPPEVRLVLTREAAKILGCSMRQVRTLAAAGTFKSWSLGPKSCAYDIEEIKKYKTEKEAGRKRGKVRGARPQGFKPDVMPSERAKK